MIQDVDVTHARENKRLHTLNHFLILGRVVSIPAISLAIEVQHQIRLHHIIGCDVLVCVLGRARAGLLNAELLDVRCSTTVLARAFHPARLSLPLSQAHTLRSLDKHSANAESASVPFDRENTIASLVAAQDLSVHRAISSDA